MEIETNRERELEFKIIELEEKLEEYEDVQTVDEDDFSKFQTMTMYLWHDLFSNIPKPGANGTFDIEQWKNASPKTIEKLEKLLYKLAFMDDLHNEIPTKELDLL